VQLRTRDGGVKFYDDLGCLLAARRGAALDPAGVFALPQPDGSWTRANAAFVVQSSSFPTPMGYGFAAFPTRAAADAEAARHTGASALALAELLGADAPAPLAHGVAHGPGDTPGTKEGRP
jgi:hypothetical protein